MILIRSRWPPLLFLLLPAMLQAHETITTKLTWTAEVSRIFQKRCISCHTEGGSAPMALTTYAGTRPWAVAIREEVLERRMPPSNVVRGFGDLANSEGLSQEEIQRIAEWVTGGAPEGEAQYLIPAPAPEAGVSALRRAGFTVEAGSVLTRSAAIRGILPVSITGGASLKLTAQRPDGSIEPLLWILKYRPEWNRIYAYRDAVRLPKGTRLQVHPPQAASFELITAGRR